MLSKCVNPACSPPFVIFMKKKFSAWNGSMTFYETVQSNFEYFWLCPVCSTFLTVVYEDPLVKVQPLHLLLPPNSVRLSWWKHEAD